MTYRSSWMTEELDVFRDQFRKFLARDLAPHGEKWRQQKMVDRSAWRALGEMGALLPSVPEAYGGAGADKLYSVIQMEELARAGVSGIGYSLHSEIVAPYILHHGTEEQKRRWLPRLATGELIGAIAMTEPGTGSDLQGVRTTALKEGDSYRINGSKTFITNGQLANLVIVVCKTDLSQGAQGMSLLVLETDALEGFRRGRNLEKLGMEAQDTSELFFDDVVVPASHLLGTQEGMGFAQLMQELPQERLIVAVAGIAAMELAMQETLAYTKDRQAFGKPIFNFQNTRFTLAECQALLMASRAMVDAVIMARSCAPLDAARSALLRALYRDISSAWTPFQPICSSRSWPGIRWPLVAPAFPYPWSWNHFIFALAPFFPLTSFCQALLSSFVKHMDV